jgi:hypothetical protein
VKIWVKRDLTKSQSEHPTAIATDKDLTKIDLR